jgi:hypothetical protein
MKTGAGGGARGRRGSCGSSVDVGPCGLVSVPVLTQPGLRGKRLAPLLPCLREDVYTGRVAAAEHYATCMPSHLHVPSRRALRVQL